MDAIRVNPWWTAEQLSLRVTDAIRTAEYWEDEAPFSEATKRAYRVVSITEELLAAAPDVSETEKDIARRGAVSAAYKAEDFIRVEMLKLRFQTA